MTDVRRLLPGCSSRTPWGQAASYGHELSFGELEAASERFVGRLEARGLRPGDHVALFLENCPQFAIVYYGALKAGAIAVC